MMFKKINDVYYNLYHVRMIRFGSWITDDDKWIKLYFVDWFDKKIWIDEDFVLFINYITNET